MAQKDYYEILGVSRTATAEEIRKAYKKLARTEHPDARPNDPGAQKRFAEITEAWEVLGDTEKRARYDKFGHGAQAGPNPFQSGAHPFQGFSGSTSVDLEDLLGGMFGGGFGGGRRGPGRGGQRTKRGDDARTEITVAFEVAAEGGEHGLTLQSGNHTEQITVKIPAGIEDGQTIRLAGQGNPGPGGGPAGDLLVTIKVAAHPYFRREGINLVVDVPVTCMEAVLGGKIDVPTLSEGEFLLNIPPGTGNGRRLRLRGKGVRNPKTGERGDLFAVVRITVPADLTEESKSLFRRLAELHPENPRAGLWNGG
ncbi:MAG: Curved DNA-binding protein [Planctomycetota bacterium]|jgi:DnaJ-class molecular chaperone